MTTLPYTLLASGPHTTPTLVKAFRAATSDTVKIQFEGFEPLATHRSYPFLVVDFTYVDRRWSRAKNDYVPTKPRAVIVKGTATLKVARDAAAKARGSIILRQRPAADGSLTYEVWL